MFYFGEKNIGIYVSFGMCPFNLYYHICKKYDVSSGKKIILTGKLVVVKYTHWNGQKEKCYILKTKKKNVFTDRNAGPDGNTIKTKEVQISLSSKMYKKLKKKKTVKLKGIVFQTDEWNDNWIRSIGMINVKIKK